MKIFIVAGARPNFMKIAPIIESLKKYNQSASKKIRYYLIHTGQHYDQQMSHFFFHDLGLPIPDIDLEVGSASHAVQTAEIMKRFENACIKENPTHVLVVGDVNSTIACALVSSKLGIKIIHVEAGLRSFDRSMPEEINRVLTDAISDFLFTTETNANENLRREGISDEKMYFVGNVMIDTLLKHKEKAIKSDILYRLGLITNESLDAKKRAEVRDCTTSSESIEAISSYAVLTLHRPSNVDSKKQFKDIIKGVYKISSEIPIIFPVHPRTLNRIREFNLSDYFVWFSKPLSKITTQTHGIICTEPLGYLEFLHLMSNAKLVLTDSGGIQEESTILRVPCVTIRENTERPITVSHGTNVIAGVKKEDIVKAALSQLTFHSKFLNLTNPPLWDGKASERIVDILIKKL